MKDLLSKYDTITLDEMSGIKLMNRTDTKFVTSVPRLMQLLDLAKTEYRAQIIDGNLIANYYTRYFDTAECTMYRMHHNGHKNRQKLRIRSYIDTGINYLEVKTKNNHGRTKKKRVEMVDFDPENTAYGLHFDANADHNEGYVDFLNTYLRYDPQSMVEQLENHFKRVTLVNKAKTERLTIDTGLAINNIVTGNAISLDEIAIIELKRDGLQPSPILGMLRQLRIMPHGFSKYCMGQAMTNPNLRCNRFKERLRDIDRIMTGKN
ncbi:MAG: polyphosphate polymerase domain-containing protein [Muribaculaceae bacterium]|nr:polyphosphate polymerase domain-containing protein [Muribaculaceae bacterium]